jgi:predicted amidohydrolase
VLPYNFPKLENDSILSLAQAESSSQGKVRRFLAELARETGSWLVAGSLPDSTRPDGSRITDRVRSVCRVYDPMGNEHCRYDKIHLFDVDVQDSQGSYRESDRFEPGSAIVCADLLSDSSSCTFSGTFSAMGHALAAAAEQPLRLGLTICYDLRFPELFGMLREAGAHIVSVPSAFTHATGKAHWEVLLRARAIENQVFVIAANQGGVHDNHRRTWGHSMIVDPWGTILDQMTDDGEGLAVARLDLHQLSAVRAAMPLLQHKRVQLREPRRK